MTELEGRVERLEEKINPLPEKPWLTVFSDPDDNGGKYWLAAYPGDCQSAMGGEGARYLTEQEFHDLELTNHIILIKYVDFDLFSGEEVAVQNDSI